MEIIGVNPTSKCLSRCLFASLTLLAACLMIFSAVVHGADDVETVLKKMEAAYDEVKDYQTDVEVKIYKKDGSFKTERSLYTFKKLKWIRLDLVSSHPRMILVYPDRSGKVLM